MSKKHCGICTSEIKQYPCPLCGYNGELERPEGRGTSVPEEELSLDASPVKKETPPPVKKKKAPAKKRKKKNSLIKWLVVILILVLLAMAGAVVLTVHLWQPATCTTPETCRICRKTQGDPLPHTWVGDCTTPGTCIVCDTRQEEAPGHSWVRPDCLTPGSCDICGAPEPEAPGHDWAAATCEAPETCTRCGETVGSPLGHSWDGTTKPAVCDRCGKELTAEEQARTLLDTESHRIFDSLFAAKDWKAVFAAGTLADAPYETAEHYAAAMSAYDGQKPELKTANAPTYEVLMDGEPIAVFTLQEKATGGWELGSMELTVRQTISATIQTPENCTISINGISLPDSAVTDRAESPAAEFLPEGTPGLQNWVWQISGLIAEPEVTAADSDGNALTVTQDKDTGTYYAAGADSSLSEEEESVVFAALESYAGFMIRAAGSQANVIRYFENGTETCKNILLMGSELWMNTDRGHKFRDETILNVQRYDEDLFAVRASLIMEATLVGGKTRDYNVRETMFFHQKNNSLVCFAMTNQDVLTAKTAPAASADEWADHPDGIRIEEYSGPNFNAHIMLVKDPSRVYLGLSSYDGFSMSKAGKRLTEAIVDEEAVAAINAGAFYDDGTSNICVGSTPAGLTIYDGEMISNIYVGLVPEKGFCGLDKDNRLVVAESMTAAEAADLNIVYGCEFGPVLIQNSKINETAYAKPGYNPRTAVGQREDGTLIFVCVDGRQAGSLGATYGELIDLLVEYGAVNACNMDGGSSTVMLTRDEDNNVSFVNSYSVLQSEPRRMPTFWLVRP